MTGLAILFAVALSAGNAEFERGASEVAADIALGRLRAETRTTGLAAGVLEKRMLGDPAKFRNRAEAEALCRTIYAEELERQFAERAKVIVERLGVSPDEPETAAPVCREAAERLFPKAFAAERAAACAAQAKSIALKVKPAEAELEAQDDAAVREGLVNRVAEVSGLVVFDENVDYISKEIVEPLIADARREQKRQQEYLMRTRCDACAPSTIGRELEANLRKNVEERQAKCDDPVRAWGVFPKTLETTLPTAVARRAVGQVLRRMADVPVEIDEGSVRKTIASAPEQHRKARESERIFFDAYALTVVSNAVEKAVADAPAAEREEFAAFVRARADSDEFRKEAQSRLRKDVLPKWKAIRGEIVKQESSRLWPTLMDGTWFPEAAVADRILARSDVETVLRDWRTSEDFGPLKASAPLEESDAAADRSVAQAFGLARKALVAENEIVEEVHPAVLRDAKELAKGVFDTKPDLAKVTEVLTAAVEKEWGARRVGLLWQLDEKPKNAEDQHVELFPSVRRRIELLARQILEELEKEEKKDEDEPKPPEHSDDSSDDSEEESDLCTIEFELQGGEVTVRAKRGGSVIAERRTKAAARNFEDAVREVGAVVGRKVLLLK